MGTPTSLVYLELNAFSPFPQVILHTKAWHCLNAYVLFSGATKRGEDDIVPMAAGDLPLPERAGGRLHTLEFQVFGTWDQDGVATGNDLSGLIANLQWLEANAGTPISTGDGTRPATLHYPAGTLTADVHAGPFEVGKAEAGKVAYCTLDIKIPAGRFS